jgi:hypothetical protein
MSKLSSLRWTTLPGGLQYLSVLAILVALGFSPARAMTPLANVTVAPNTTQTLQTGPTQYYPQVTVQNKGRAIVNDEVFVQNLLVQAGGILQVNVNGMLNGAVFTIVNNNPNPVPTTYNLQAGAILEIAIPQALPFQQFTTFSISPATNYVFNGTVPQRTTSALIGSPLQPLPSQIGSLTVNNPTTLTLGAPVAMTGELRLQNGVFTLGGQRLTLLATAQRTAIVLPTGGSIAGNTATVQRPISAGLNAGVGYRHLSSPMQDAPVSDLATASFTPVVNPAYNSNRAATPFPTVFGYDQSRVTPGNTLDDFDRGWTSPNATTDVLQPGRGYTVNLNGGQIVDFNGTPTAGPVVVSSQRGNGPQAGWLFAGNPYAAPIAWSQVARTGLDNAVYVFRSSGQYTGTYSSFVNGIANNGGSDTLALGQGFFTRVSTPATTGTITFGDTARVSPRTQPVVFRNSPDTRPLLTLGLRPAGSTANLVQSSVYFEAGASAAFDAAYDAVALPAPGQPLMLATKAGTEALSINGQPLLSGTDVVLPLQASATTTGTYTLQVEALRNLPATYHAYLRDALTGTYTDLATTATVSLTLAANAPAAGRYALVFTPQARVLATASQELAQLVSVYPNPAHATATLLLPLALRGHQATPVQVLDNLGRVVLTRTLAAGTTETLELPLGSLAPGVYSVQAKTALGLIAKRLVVQ